MIKIEQDSEEVYDQAHDWYQLLTRTGHLQSDQVIAHNLRIAATIAFFIGLVTGLLLITYMLSSSVRRVMQRPSKKSA